MTIERHEHRGIVCYHTPRRKGVECIFWLHGYTLSSDVWTDIWSRIEEYDHISIDIPGHGQSCQISDFQDLPQLTRAVFDTIQQHQADHVVGFSFGGILGLQLAVLFPDRFRTLTLISSPYGGSEVDPEAQMKNQELARLYKERGRGPWLTQQWMQSPPDIFKGLRKRSEEFMKISAIIDGHSWTELLDNGFGIFTSFKQYSAELRRIGFPVFLLVGEDDMEYIKRCNQDLTKILTNCKRVYLPGCGHLPLLEDPEATIRCIRVSLSEIKQ